LKYDANPGGSAQAQILCGVRRNLIQRRTLIVSRQISKIFNSVELENLPYLDSLQAGKGTEGKQNFFAPENQKAIPSF